MSNPFKFLDAITWTKDDEWSEESENDYVAFLINRHFSQFPDTVLYANDLNQRHHASKRMQFLYLINSLPKRKRFGKWKKKTENADIKVISAYLQINEAKAEEVLPLVSQPELEIMRQHYEHVTGSGSGNVRRGKTKRP